MRIFHIATAADWAEAQRTGRYTTSTRGRTLADEGFIHASRGDQWQGVRERFYSDVHESLVLLVIDTDALGVPVVEEAVPDSDETFPHVYGAIPTAAVLQTIPLDDPEAPAPPATATAPAGETSPPRRSLFSLWLEEFSVRAGLALVVIVVAVLVGLGVVALAGDLPGLLTMLALLVVGLGATTLLLRRRERRLGDQADSGA